MVWSCEGFAVDEDGYRSESTLSPTFNMCSQMCQSVWAWEPSKPALLALACREDSEYPRQGTRWFKCGRGNADALWPKLGLAHLTHTVLSGLAGQQPQCGFSFSEEEAFDCWKTCMKTTCNICYYLCKSCHDRDVPTSHVEGRKVSI